MPIKIEYLDDGIGVLFIGEGIITGEDIISSNNHIFSSEDKMTNFKYGLIEYSDITQYEVSNSEIEIIASQDKTASKYISEAVVAIVAIEDLEFGVSRMWEMFVENAGLKWETMVHRDREAAESWIKERVKEKFGINDLTFD